MMGILKASGHPLLITIALMGVFVFGCFDSRIEEGPFPPEQLAEEIRDAFGEPTHIGRITQLTALLEELDPANLSAVRDVFDETMAGLSNAEVGCFISAWAQLDRHAAHDYARAIPFDTQREEALAIAIHEWAVQSPLEARLAAEALEIPGRKRAAQPLVRLVRGWVHHSDSGVAAYLRGHAEDSDLLSAAIQEIFRVGGADSLVRWADDFIAKSESADQQWQAFRKTVRTLGYREPEAATRWVSEHYGVDEFARDGPEVLARAWVRRDPPGAIDWVLTGAPAEARNEALQAAFSRWLSVDRAAADAWLGEHPNDPDLYPAYVATAKNAIRSRNPERAIEYCGRVPPSELMQNCLHALAVNWYGWDAVAAGEWMESSELDPELRDSVRATQQKLRKRRQG